MKKHGDNSLQHQNLVDDMVMFSNCLFLLLSLFLPLQESVLSHIVRASVTMKLLALAL